MLEIQRSLAEIDCGEETLMEKLVYRQFQILSNDKRPGFKVGYGLSKEKTGLGPGVPLPKN